MLRLLSKEPSERFQSAEKVSQRLGQWLRHLQSPASALLPQTAAPSPLAAGDLGENRRRPRIRGLVALAAGALALLAGVVVFVQLGETTVRFEVEAPELAIQFGKEEITIDNEGEKIQIRPGQDQFFVVSQHGTAVAGYTFKLKRGKSAILHASIVDDKVQMSSEPDGIAIPPWHRGYYGNRRKSSSSQLTAECPRQFRIFGHRRGLPPADGQRTLL